MLALGYHHLGDFYAPKGALHGAWELRPLGNGARRPCVIVSMPFRMPV